MAWKHRARPEDEDVKAEWQSYQRDGNDDARNALMEHYLPVVHYTAERLYRKLPNEVELDDLVSAGVFGLMDAIDAFDQDRGVKFTTYCSARIRGAILDELRAMDWVPRLVRSRSTKVDRASRVFKARHGRPPTHDEIADALGVDDHEYEKIRRDAGAVNMHSLSRKWYETDSHKDVCEIDILEDNRQTDPFNEVERGDLKAMLTRGLTRSERLIVILYYYEELTMKEIGATLDLSESRVSQMHSSILARLKACVEKRREPLHVASA
ncbi:MAG: FliA/WhiG family RNA polymerase sigma factor [Phycisphaeraceae bacterium]|nr:FliA/WhiG family RNA polymerase sigma factor [Phycisphaeraceae bacterium]